MYRKNQFRFYSNLLIIFALTFSLISTSIPVQAATNNPQIIEYAQQASFPETQVNVAVVHDSVGQQWLQSDFGQLEQFLNDNNYSVSGTADSISLFNQLFSTGSVPAGTSISSLVPAIEATQVSIIMTPQLLAPISGNPEDTPNVINGPIADFSVANIKGIYNSILSTLANDPNHLFIMVTTPAQPENLSNTEQADRLRGINNWLVNDWLTDYEHDNVIVFDLFNVLTSNGGDANTSDLNEESGNHHRIWNDSIQHVQANGSNFLAYAISDESNQPNAVGLQKASAELLPILNHAYLNWSGSNTPEESEPASAPEPTEEIPANNPEEPQPTAVEKTEQEVEESNPPANPSSLAEQSRTETSITLSWRDMSQDEQGFNIERSANNADWQLLAAVGAGRETFQNTGLSCGEAYYYRLISFNESGSSEPSNVLYVRTNDCATEIPAATEEPTATQIPTEVPAPESTTLQTSPLPIGKHDDSHADLVYKGSWNSYSSILLFNGSTQFTQNNGDSVSGSFIGDQLIIFYTGYSNKGQANVYIDGNLVDVINQYSRFTRWQKRWKSNQIDQGLHTFIVEHAEGGPIDVDAIKINGSENEPTQAPTNTSQPTSTNTLPPAPTQAEVSAATGSGLREGMYDDLHGGIHYDHAWSTFTADGLYNGGTHYSNSPGAKVSIPFYGTQIIYYYSTSDNKGVVDLYLDGELIGRVNQYSPEMAWQQTWESPVLESGNHELVIEFVENGFIDLDAIRISSESSAATNTPAPTATETAEPTLTNTVVPTATATAEPTLTNTSVPTATATAEPTNTSQPASNNTPPPAPTQTETNAPSGSGLSEGMYDDLHGGIHYDHAWSTFTGDGLYKGGTHYSNSPGAKVSIPFYGTQITYYYSTSESKGVVDLYLDGELIGRVDQFSSQNAWQQTWESPVLELGSHELVIEFIETGFIDLDAVQISSESSAATNTPAPVATETSAPTATQEPETSPTPEFTATVIPTNTQEPTEEPTEEPISGVQNDDFLNPTNIELVNNQFEDQLDIEAATSSANDPELPCMSSAGYNSIWYQFTPQEPGRISIQTDNSTFNTALALWDPADDPMSSLICQADTNNNISFLHTQIDHILEQGSTYYIEIVSETENPNGELSLQVTFDPIQPLTEGSYDDTNQNLIYSPEWRFDYPPQSYNETLHYSNEIGSSIRVPFNGESISFYYSGQSNAGLVDIYIDNVFLATLNQYSSESSYQNIWNSPKMDDIEHSLELIHSAGNYVSLDGVIIDQTLAHLEAGIYDDSHSSISQAMSGWQMQEQSGAFNNTIHYSETVGNTISLGFTGSQFSVLYTSYMNRGIMDIFVDGILLDSLNQYSSSIDFQEKWTSQKLSHGHHIVTFKHAEGEMVDIDGIMVDTSNPVAPGEYDDTNDNVQYSGNWQYFSGEGPYNNTFHHSDTIGSTAALVFNGTQVSLLYSGLINGGTVDISIDDTWVATFNQYVEQNEFQRVWESSILSPGTHTITVTHAAGSIINVDAFLVSGQTENLLENFDFEESTVSPWEGITNQQIVTNESQSGSQSIRISEGEALQRWMEVIPGQTYTLSGWFMWKEFGSGDWGYDHITITGYDWQRIESQTNLHSKYESDIWNKIALTFTPETDKVQVSFGMFGPQSNVELYFDNLSLMGKQSNTPPTLTASADVTSGDVPLNVNFTAVAQDADGGIKNISWDFGDGSSSTLLNPTHTFTQRGVYLVAVTVWDNDDASTTKVLSIEVSDGESPLVDIENPTAGNEYSTSDHEILISGHAIGQTGAEITSVIWDNVSTNQAGIISISSDTEIAWSTSGVSLKPGNNEILITASDDQGRIGTDRVNINRSVNGPSVSNIQVQSGSVAMYEPYEILFAVNTVAENSFFLYDENPPSGVEPGIGVTVEAIITTPTGKVHHQPAFFAADVNQNGSINSPHFEETGSSQWNIRYSPQEMGQHNVSLRVQDSSGTTSTSVGSFNATSAQKQGFVQVSQNDSRYFEYSNGDIFWPIGPANGNDLSEYTGSGINLVRPWMAGYGAYSTNWARWISTAKTLGNEGFDSNLSYDEHFPSSELSQILSYPDGQRIWIGYANGSLYQTQLKSGADYQVKLRLKTTNMSGPVNPSLPSGVMVKKHGWPTDTLEEDLRAYPSFLSEISTDRDWHTVVGVYTASSRDSEATNPYLSIFLDNVSSGDVYIDQLSIREILPSGQLGGELVMNSKADMHTYVEPKAAAYFDWQVEQGEQNDVYFKYVVFDKRDWIPDHLSDTGIFVENGGGYYQGEGTKAYWLQQQWWRYLIARWGYSTAVHSWELNNEGSPDSTAHYQATQNFAKFMHDNDPHPHMATTSFWCCWRPDFWGDNNNYPDIDYADIHEYTEGDLSKAYDLAGWQLSAAEEVISDDIGKPVIRGEVGIGGVENYSYFSYLQQPNEGIWYHNLLWSQLNEGALFDPNYWWSSHREQIDMQAISTPFYNFVKDLDFNRGGYVALDADVSNSDLRVAGQKNIAKSKAIFWVQNQYHTWRNVMGVDNPQTINPESGTITFTLSANRNVSVEFWNTYTGEMISSANRTTDGSGRLSISISNLESDVAIKVYGEAQQVTLDSTDWVTHAKDFSRSASVPNELSSDNLNLQWKRFLGERIEVEMEPIVVGDLLYIGLMNGKMYALNKDTGDTVWVYNSGMGITNSPSVAPTDIGTLIFFGSTNGTIYALDAATGTEMWKYTTGGAIMSSPAISNNQVFIGSLDGTFYALDANNGSLNWYHNTGSPISTSPAIGGEIRPGEAGIYFANGSNMAYGFSEYGSLVWQQQMSGLFTKRTYAVYANDVAMFVTRKPGSEYAEPAENLPAELQGSSQPGNIVISAWADYYQDYPKRRTLYYFDAQNGTDLWSASSNKDLYTPLYLPYWGEYLPVVDDDGFAYFAASGSGGDHALEHDFRLWKINLQTGEYTHIAQNEEFLPRFDEVGRMTLAGDRLYQTVSEDVGYYNIQTGQLNSDVFGNGPWNHRHPIELDEMSGNTVFGGWHKYFTRFGSSTPGGFGGANDAPSPLVIVGDKAYYTAWGHIYALTTSYVTPSIDYGSLDIASTPNRTYSRQTVQAELNQSIQYIVDNNIHIEAASRMWSWYPPQDHGNFWHEGEVIRTLAETLPYLNTSTANALKSYLQTEIENNLLDSKSYEYARVCLDYDTGELQDPCGSGSIQTSWFKDNGYLIMERLYAIYKYSEMSGDSAMVTSNWSFIENLYNKIDESWDQEAGLFLFPTWHAGNDINFNTQIAAITAIRNMADMAGDTTAYNQANDQLSRMLTQRVYWGNYVRNLYNSGQLSQQNYNDWEDWGYQQSVAPIPIEGYLGQDNDYRQIYTITRNGNSLDVAFTSPHRVLYPYELVGFHPYYAEAEEVIENNFTDILGDYIAAIERIAPFWYMGDYYHAPVIGNSEDDSMSPLLATDIFQTKAHIFNQSFDELAPYLPWTFEDYGPTDIFRLQNLTTLLSAP